MATKRRNIRRPKEFEESKMEGYFMICKRDAAKAIANKLTGCECRLWLYLMMIDPFADYTSGGEIRYHDLPPIPDIAIAVGSSPSTVEKDLRKLRTLGLYDYRVMTVQGHNLTSAKAKAEAERLSKEKPKTHSKSNHSKGWVYLSSDTADLSSNGDYLNSDTDYLSHDTAYLSSQQSPKPLLNEDSSTPQTIQTYSDFIKTLSEHKRASFLDFCNQKAKNLSQEVNDIEAWLAHKTKAGKNRWEVYYEQFLSHCITIATKKPQSELVDEAMKQFQSEIEQQKQQARKVWSQNHD